ncbi:hypothetical protein DXG01_006484 [Tephrocybe rancida]|nr:hypothetical protein DXG01_006484 [Tephrocybe rancida]
MRLSTTVFTGLSLVLPTFAATPALTIEKYAGETTGKYIVTLKQGVSKSSFLKTTQNTPSHEWTLINGFASELSPAALDALRTHSDVESIAEDGVVNPFAFAIQDDALWGLSRLTWQETLAEQNATAADFVYVYDDTAGAGVDVYVIGGLSIVLEAEFQGRARWGATFGPYPDEDLHGHGTHCAGTVAGQYVGVAKNVSIIAVKVLGAGVNGLSGMDWVASAAHNSSRPSVASMAFGGRSSNALDNAALAAAAGNGNIDADAVSPARSPSVITVGASNIKDERASFSNFGAVIDIFAPGETVWSAYIGGNATNPLYKIGSGTSMAASHLSGLVAYLIALGGNISPAEMSDKVKGLDLKGVLKGIREHFCHA